MLHYNHSKMTLQAKIIWNSFPEWLYSPSPTNRSRYNFWNSHPIPPLFIPVLLDSEYNWFCRRPRYVREGKPRPRHEIGGTRDWLVAASRDFSVSANPVFSLICSLLLHSFLSGINRRDFGGCFILGKFGGFESD